MFFQEANAFNRFFGRANKILVAGCAGENERVPVDVFCLHPVLFCQKLKGTFGNFEFPLPGHAHSLVGIIVNGAYDEGCAILPGNRDDLFKAFFPVLKVYRIDDGLALAVRERFFNNLFIRGVDHQRDFDHFDDTGKECFHVLEFVTIRIGQADIDNLGAVFNLGAGNFSGLFHPPFSNEAFELPAANDVGSFADNDRSDVVGDLQVFNS